MRAVISVSAMSRPRGYLYQTKYIRGHVGTALFRVKAYGDWGRVSILQSGIFRSFKCILFQ